MNRRRTLFALFGVILVAGAILAAILLTRRPQSPDDLRVGYLPIASDASFFVALDRGYLEREGLRIQPIRFETSNQAIEALVAGRIDATAPIALETALALEANTPGQFKIAEMTAATADTKVHRILVPTSSEIRSLEDLRGKTIGTFPGSQMVVFLKLILGRYFDPERELRIIQIRPPLQPQALESGQIDALFCLEPTCTLLESRGAARAIAVNPLFEYIQQPFPTAASLIATRTLRDNPRVGQKFMAALDSAHAWIKSFPDSTAGVLPKYTPIQADIAPRIALYDYWSVSRIDTAAVRRLADLYSQRGVLETRVSTNELYLAPQR